MARKVHPRLVYWIRSLYEHADLTCMDREILVYLATWKLDFDTGTGHCSVAALADKKAGGLGCSERTVKDALARAVEHRLLVRTRRGHRLGDGTVTASEWRIVYPEPTGTQVPVGDSSTCTRAHVEDSSTGTQVHVEDGSTCKSATSQGEATAPPPIGGSKKVKTTTTNQGGGGGGKLTPLKALRWFWPWLTHDDLQELLAEMRANSERRNYTSPEGLVITRAKEARDGDPEALANLANLLRDNDCGHLMIPPCGVCALRIDGYCGGSIDQPCPRDPRNQSPDGQRPPRPPPPSTADRRTRRGLDVAARYAAEEQRALEPPGERDYQPREADGSERGERDPPGL
jgi:hypothetical protein